MVKRALPGRVGCAAGWQGTLSAKNLHRDPGGSLRSCALHGPRRVSSHQRRPDKRGALGRGQALCPPALETLTRPCGLSQTSVLDARQSRTVATGRVKSPSGRRAMTSHLNAWWWARAVSRPGTCSGMASALRGVAAAAIPVEAVGEVSGHRRGLRGVETHVGEADLPGRPVSVKVGDGHERLAIDRAFITVGELHHDFIGRAGADIYESADGHAFAGEPRLVANPPGGNRLIAHWRWSRGEGGAGLRCAHAKRECLTDSAGVSIHRGPAEAPLGRLPAERGGQPGQSRGAR